MAERDLPCALRRKPSNTVYDALSDAESDDEDPVIVVCVRSSNRLEEFVLQPLEPLRLGSQSLIVSRVDASATRMSPRA